MQFYRSIRPGFKKGDPQVTDLRCIKYDVKGEILYKLNYSDDWNILEKRKTEIFSISTITPLPNLYKEPLKIDKKKFENLQALKAVLDKEFHNFYDNLPHKP